MKKFLRKRRFEILLSTLYLLLSVIITYPLVLNFNSSIYGLSEEYVLEADVPYSTPVRNADAYAGIWELWWKKQAFLQGTSWELCPLLGVSGTIIDKGFLQMPLVNTVGRWLTILFNEVFAFNFLILLSFPLAGIAMYLLAFEVTRNRWASALAGFIFAFAPLHRRYAFEWLGMAQWHWLPLYVLSLLKLDKTKAITWGLLTGLLFSITFIENYYFGYFAAFFTIFFVLFRLLQTWLSEKKLYLDRRRLKLYLLAFLTILVLTLPVFSPFVGESRRMAAGMEAEIGGFVTEEWQRFALSARPWYYILPDVNHPVLGGLTTRFYNWISKKPPFFLTQPFYPREHSLYLGWTVLILSGAAILKRARLLKSSSEPRSGSRQLVWLFLFLGIMMAIFSAPPFATISLRKIYFPSHYLYKFFPMFRSYARFGVLVLLCFSVLAAFGTKFLLEKIKFRGRCSCVFLFLCFLVFFEFLDFPPFHNVSLKTLPVYEWLADQPGDFGILVYPQDVSNFDLLAQRVHKKRFLNPKGLETPEVEEVRDNLNDEKSLTKLREWGVKYVLVRRDFSLGLEANYTLVKRYEKPTVHLFEVPNP